MKNLIKTIIGFWWNKTNWSIKMLTFFIIFAGIVGMLPKKSPEDKEVTELNATVKRGFDTFALESKLATKALDCREPKITPASGSWGALYGCIQGRAETVKWFINEKAGTGKVANVKLMWNDWSKDVGYGIHADKREAQKALNTLISIYAPMESQLLDDTFWGKTNKTIESNNFTFDYSYTSAPTIDERLIVVKAR
ncbi:hypothetical protein [Vibrio sp. V09_P4A23P171]|nr:hypothetical protein [Vibrio sp. V09_P4A23P171]